MEDPDVLIKRLKDLQQVFRDLRDKQNVVPCDDKEAFKGTGICNYFDQTVDSIDDIIKKIKKDGHKYKKFRVPFKKTIWGSGYVKAVDINSSRLLNPGTWYEEDDNKSNYEFDVDNIEEVDL